MLLKFHFHIFHASVLAERGILPGPMNCEGMEEGWREPFLALVVAMSVCAPAGANWRAKSSCREWQSGRNPVLDLGWCPALGPALLKDFAMCGNNFLTVWARGSVTFCNLKKQVNWQDTQFLSCPRVKPWSLRYGRPVLRCSVLLELTSYQGMASTAFQSLAEEPQAGVLL